MMAAIEVCERSTPQKYESQEIKIGIPLGLSFHSLQIMESMDTFFRKSSNLEESQLINNGACTSNLILCVLSTITGFPLGNIIPSKQSLQITLVPKLGCP